MIRIFKSLLHLILVFIIPLIWNHELIFSREIISIMMITILLLITQPPINLSEIKTHVKTDKHTIWSIVIISTIGQIMAIVEWSLNQSNRIFDNGLFFYVGLLLMILGIVIRIVSISKLGYNFSGTVTIKTNQSLITSGIYKHLRHPSYTGAWLVMLGSSIMLNSIFGILILGVGMLFVYNSRIKIEEQTLIKGFGKTYKLYQMNTWKMFPHIW